jgi:DNA-binding GntR family transcriptional regulator
MSSEENSVTGSDVPDDLDEISPQRTANELRAFLKAVPAHGSTTDAVTDALREAILDGRLAPSTWLREDDLARQLQVSRTPVREALRRLSDEHLAVRAAHRGTLVAPMGLDDILAVYLVRETLEGLAARMTAQRQPHGTVEALTSVHHKMIAAADLGDTAALAKLNLDFHRALREGSGNSYLDRFLTQVEHAVRRFGRTTFQAPGRTVTALAEHGAIIEAVAAADPDLAAERAAEHMRRAREVRVQEVLGL